MPEHELTYVVAGMSCEHCRAAVTEEVAKVAGVRRRRRRPRHQARARPGDGPRRRGRRRGDRRGRLRRGVRVSAAAKLAGFAAVLVLAFGGAAFAGSRIDVHPGESDPAPAMAGHGEEASVVQAVRGLAVSDRGLTLELARTTATRGERFDARLPHRRPRRPDRARLRRRAHQAHARHRRAPRPDRLPARAPGPAPGRHLVGARHAARRRRLPRVRRLLRRRRAAHARRRPRPSTAQPARRRCPRPRRRSRSTGCASA